MGGFLGILCLLVLHAGPEAAVVSPAVGLPTAAATQHEVDPRDQQLPGLQDELRAAREALDRADRLLAVVVAMAVLLLAGGWLWLRWRLGRQAADNGELKRIDGLKDEFLAATTHELRTPLNGMVSVAQSILDDEPRLPEKIRHDLELIVTTGKRLAHMVDDILDFARLKQDRLRLDPAPVDVRPAVEEVMALLRPLAAHKPVELRNEISPELPAVQVDGNRFQQILHNLVGNALKFTDDGEIRILARADGEWIEITVRDTGIGIPLADRESIFDPFEQVDRADRRNYAGAGLGLAITRRLVEMHGGRIRVESPAGEGTAFSFNLPRAGR